MTDPESAGSTSGAQPPWRASDGAIHPSERLATPAGKAFRRRPGVPPGPDPQVSAVREYWRKSPLVFSLEPLSGGNGGRRSRPRRRCPR